MAEHIPQRIKVFRERYESENYWIRRNGKLGTPIVIDIKECYISYNNWTREDAESDVKMLVEHLPKLGFEHPHVISSSANKTILSNKENFFNELERIARDDSMTKDADVFLCIIMAHGEGNVFYLPNFDRVSRESNDRYTVDINDVINIFKSDHCNRLVCKPKIFIMHTDDFKLTIEDRSRYVDEIGAPQTRTIPVEADILVYQSKLSARYTKDIAKNDPDKYEELRQRGLVPGWDDTQHTSGTGGGDTPRKPQKGTQFIYLLCEAVKTMIKEERFDLIRWILLTNDFISQYLKTKYWEAWKWGKGCWTINPSLPLCSIQLTKKLLVDIPQEEKKEK